VIVLDNAHNQEIARKKRLADISTHQKFEIKFAFAFSATALMNISM
jgi:hypothetical protein